MLEFLGGDALAAFQGFQYLLETHVLTVAEIGFRAVGGTRDQLQRFRIVFLDDEAAGVGDGTVHADGLDDSDVRLVGLRNHALDFAGAHFLAVIIDQEDFPGAFRQVELQRKEQLVLVLTVTEDGKAGSLRQALHAADALVIVDDRRD